MEAAAMAARVELIISLPGGLDYKFESAESVIKVRCRPCSRKRRNSACGSKHQGASQTYERQASIIRVFAMWLASWGSRHHMKRAYTLL